MTKRIKTGIRRMLSGAFGEDKIQTAKPSKKHHRKTTEESFIRSIACVYKLEPPQKKITIVQEFGDGNYIERELRGLHLLSAYQKDRPGEVSIVEVCDIIRDHTEGELFTSLASSLDNVFLYEEEINSLIGQYFNKNEDQASLFCLAKDVSGNYWSICVAGRLGSLTFRVRRINNRVYWDHKTLRRVARRVNSKHRS